MLRRSLFYLRRRTAATPHLSTAPPSPAPKPLLSNSSHLRRLTGATPPLLTPAGLRLRSSCPPYLSGVRQFCAGGVKKAATETKMRRFRHHFSEALFHLKKCFDCLEKCVDCLPKSLQIFCLCFLLFRISLFVQIKCLSMIPSLNETEDLNKPKPKASD